MLKPAGVFLVCCLAGCDPSGGGGPSGSAGLVDAGAPAKAASEGSSLAPGPSPVATFQSGPCMEAPCPEIVAETEEPTSIAVQGSEVYWTTKTAVFQAAKVPAPGASPAVLADGLASPHGLALDETYLYWTEQSATNTSRLVSLPLAGGDPSVLAEVQGASGGALVVGAMEMYWEGISGAISRVSKSGGEPTLIARATDEGTYGSALAVDASNLYWMYSTPQSDAALVSVPLQGGGNPYMLTRLVTTARGSALGLVVDHGWLHWTLAYTGGSGNSERGAVPVGGGEPQTSVTEGGLSNIVVSDGFVYWAEIAYDGPSSKLMKAPSSGGAEVLVSQLHGFVSYLAVGGGDVVFYWFGAGNVQGTPAIMKLSPP